MQQHNPALASLLAEIRSCNACAARLPLGANPVVRAHSTARILLVGQAPGTRVHATGIPWNDASGDRLRAWLRVSRSVFYDETRFAIAPMGFCYPGKGKSGDSPPRPECAPLWRAKLHALLPELRLVLLIGAHAVRYYLFHRAPVAKLIATTDFARCSLLPLVHPSPRNQLWLKKNPWFEGELIPVLRRRVHALL